MNGTGIIETRIAAVRRDGGTVQGRKVRLEIGSLREYVSHAVSPAILSGVTVVSQGDGSHVNLFMNMSQNLSALEPKPTCD
jgi:hypothetical protein